MTTSQSQYLSDINVLSYLSLNIDLDFCHSPLLSLPTSVLDSVDKCLQRSSAQA
jgi:hypothetical protein